MKRDTPSYRGYRFPPEIHTNAVWLYHRVPQSGNGRTQDASNHCPTSYRKDDGRPVEVGYQEQASNHLKRLSLRAAVVSVEETSSKTRKAPLQQSNGCVVSRCRGTPQGGVVSPLLSNLFLHYVFDVWMKRHYPTIAWCRYADDGLVHCHSLQQARVIRDALERRFRECGLELHPQKTKIVYCKDGKRRGTYPVKQFDFLGYTFRGRTTKGARGRLFFSFNPAVSKEALKTMRSRIRKSNLRNRADRDIEDIAREFNPVLQGWLNYYRRFNRSALYPFLRYFNHTLRAWVMCKYKRFRGKRTRAGQYLARMAKHRPGLFAHWHLGMTGVFA